MKNKNIIRIIYGTVAIIIIVMATIMIKNKNKNKNGEWETYKNEEFNIEMKVPAGMEIELEK